MHVKIHVSYKLRELHMVILTVEAINERDKRQRLGFIFFNRQIPQFL